MVRSSEEAGEDASEAGIEFWRGILVFKIDLVSRTHDASAVFLLLYNFIKFLFDFGSVPWAISAFVFWEPDTPSLFFVRSARQ